MTALNLYMDSSSAQKHIMAPNRASSARVLCPVKEESELHHSSTETNCAVRQDNKILSATSSGTCSESDSSVFPLPDVEEEPFDSVGEVSGAVASSASNPKEYRARSGSTGLKNLFNFKKSRNKSGDSSKGSPVRSSSPTNADSSSPDKTNKSFISLFRQRSQSDASAARNAMMRRRHISQGGAPLGPAVVDVSNTAAMMNNNNIDAFRGRSTSWGAKAKERLAASKQLKISGLSPNNGGMTAMSQLLGTIGSSPVNRKLEKVKLMDMDYQHSISAAAAAVSLSSSQTSIASSCGSVGSNSSAAQLSPTPATPDFTGKAFIWHRANSVDESASRRQAPATAQTRRAQFLNTKWNTADVMETEFEDLVRGDPEIFSKFMRAHKCYDLIPTSAKLIVFDTKLSVKKAFYALVYNCVRAAPLWDSASQDFIGMLTISDFILILTKYYTSPEAEMTELEEHKISTWREVLSDKYHPLVYVTPDTSLFDAVKILIKSKVHRLPIIDPIAGNALYILTHKRVLKFLYLFMRKLPQPPFMDDTIDDLGIGTYSNIASVTMNTRLIDALTLFVSRRVSALPVVNENNQVEGIYAKFDVINLAADKTYNNLEVPISHALSYRRPTQDTPVHSCHRTDSLKNVVEKFVRAEVHRLIIVDHCNRLEGVVSLSDVLSYLLRDDKRFASESLHSTSCSDSEAVLTLEDDGDAINMSFSDIILEDRPSEKQVPTAAAVDDDNTMEVFPVVNSLEAV